MGENTEIGGITPGSLNRLKCGTTFLEFRSDGETNSRVGASKVDDHIIGHFHVFPEGLNFTLSTSTEEYIVATDIRQGEGPVLIESRIP